MDTRLIEALSFSRRVGAIMLLLGTVGLNRGVAQDPPGHSGFWGFAAGVGQPAPLTPGSDQAYSGTLLLSPGNPSSCPEMRYSSDGGIALIGYVGRAASRHVDEQLEASVFGVPQVVHPCVSNLMISYSSHARALLGLSTALRVYPTMNHRGFFAEAVGGLRFPAFDVATYSSPRPAIGLGGGLDVRLGGTDFVLGARYERIFWTSQVRWIVPTWIVPVTLGMRFRIG